MMSKICELNKYIDYEFSSGFYTGEDYRQFERKYINILKTICKNNNWCLVKINKNHYCTNLTSKFKNIYIGFIKI